MVKEIKQCERMRENPKWPSYKSVLARIDKGPNVSDEYELNVIREYVERGDAFAKPSMPVPNTDNVTRSNAEWMAVKRCHKVLATASDNPKWLGELACWMRYYQVGIWQLFFWAGQFDIIAKAVGNDRRRQNQNGVRSCPLPRFLRDKLVSCFLYFFLLFFPLNSLKLN